MADLMNKAQAPLRMLDRMGEELAFYVRALIATPRSVTRYPKEILRLLAEVTLGSGALAVIGGTVGVITAMAFFTGTEVGLQGYAALNQIGTAAFSGFVSAYFNTREIAPLVAGIALAATVGCGFTAQLGAMRISEEVDALEVMAIPSMPFRVTTRIVAAYKGMNAAGGPKGVGDAVNESVVITFMLLFVVNFVMSAIYFQLVPPKTG